MTAPAQGLSPVARATIAGTVTASAKSRLITTCCQTSAVRA